MLLIGTQKHHKLFDGIIGIRFTLNQKVAKNDTLSTPLAQYAL